MLEVKNLALASKSATLFEGLSFTVGDGELLCVTGETGAGKSLLLRAIMGLHPIKEGHVSIDGELLTPASACEFRRLMAFVPQEMPVASGRAEAMLRLPFGLEANRGVAFSKAKLLAQWKPLGLDEILFSRDVTDIKPSERLLMLLSVAGMMGKDIVLVDDIASAIAPEDEALVADYLHKMAQGGVSVLAVSRSGSFAQQFDKSVSLPSVAVGV